MNMKTRRTGATLIDVATGSMILAVLLIPSVHLIGKAKSSNRRVTTRDALLYAGDNSMESVKAALADPAAFAAAYGTTTDRVQSILVADVPDCASRLRIAADGSVAPAQLLTIVVDVWQDLNRNGLIDADEPSETLRTQQASP